MKFKQLEESKYVLVFQAGDEVVSELVRWAAETGTKTATLTGIGALSEAEVGIFDPESKEYERLRVSESVELLSLTGNLTISEGQPRVHAHVVLSGRDGRAFGGHLFSARVRPTLEVFVTELPGELTRATDPESGLPLIDLV